MKKKKIKYDWYSFTVVSWMVNKYNLTGYSLMIYAMLFSWTQGIQSCVIDYKFIKACTGMTPSEVDIILEDFKKRGMIDFDGIYCTVLID